MTVSTQSNKIIYQGNGATTAFPFTFAVPGGLTQSQASGDLTVTFVDANGNSTPIAYGPGSTQYQLTVNPPISPNPTSVGGTVTYNPGGNPIPIGTSLVIQRTVPSVQGTSLQNQGTLWQQAIEQALDYLTMLEQGVVGTVSQALLAPVSDPPNLNYTAPAVASRANKLLGFDANGNVVAISGTAPIGPPVGAQTITAPWTFTGFPPVTLQNLNDTELRFVDVGSNTPYYNGTISTGSGTTVTLSANPTNVLTGNPCCNNDSTILNACVILTGGGATQVAQIGSYNATTRVITITGNVYNMAGTLIGSTFFPTPLAGFAFSIGRFDYGHVRQVAFHFLYFSQFWNLPNPASGGAAAPYTGGQSLVQQVNRLTSETNFVFPITGYGAADPFYICANFVFNAGPPQNPVHLSLYTLQSSGDTGNTGNFPPTFPVTYNYFEALRVTPHAYSAGVLTANPYVTIPTTVSLAVGTSVSIAPDSTFVVSQNNSPTKVPPGNSAAHIVGANGGPTYLTLDTFGVNATGNIGTRFARGSAGAETAVQSGDTLGIFGSFGYGATAYSGRSRAAMFVVASENWSDTAQGAQLIFQTTQPTTLITTEAGRIWGSGGLSVGALVDPGTGGIHASGNIGAGAAIAASTSLSAGTSITAGGQIISTGGVLVPGAFSAGTLPGGATVGSIAFVSNGPNAPSWGQAVSAGGTPELAWWNGSQWKVFAV